MYAAHDGYITNDVFLDVYDWHQWWFANFIKFLLIL